MPGRVLGKQKSEQWQGMYACRCGGHLLIAWLVLLAAAVAARDLHADGEQCAVEHSSASGGQISSTTTLRSVALVFVCGVRLCKAAPASGEISSRTGSLPACCSWLPAHRTANTWCSLSSTLCAASAWQPHQQLQEGECPRPVPPACAGSTPHSHSRSLQDYAAQPFCPDGCAEDGA